MGNFKFVAAALAFMTPAMFGAVHAADGKAVEILQPWVRASPGGAKLTAAFMEIKSDNGDALIGAKTSAASRVEVHTHIMEGDVMKMRRVDKLEIAKGASKALKPMGDHLMLFDLKEPLKEGDHVKLTLTFEKAGDVEVDAVVEAVGALGPKGAAKDENAPKASSGHEHHEGH